MNRTILLAGGADYISLHTYLALLRVIELAGCRRLVLFSLASVYGIPDGVPTSETAPCPPRLNQDRGRRNAGKFGTRRTVVKSGVAAWCRSCVRATGARFLLP
tara:strand:+ start:192 stop:500 length:309 start_codon:yes stop_codon:yes gene_type:complete